MIRKLSKEICVVRSPKYTVQCTPRGRKVYVYNELDEEIAVFQDMAHTVQCLISPDQTQIALRSICGTVAIYSTADMSLTKKFRYGSDGQDGGFCFSFDGKRLFVVESVCKNDLLYARLVSYDTASYAEKRVDFERLDVELLNVSQGQKEDELLLLGYKRNKDGIGFLHFLAKTEDGEIKDIRYFKDQETAFFMTSWEGTGEADMLRIFNSLPAPTPFFERDLSVFEQWDIIEAVCDVTELIGRYREICDPQPFVFPDELKDQFQSMLQGAIDKTTEDIYGEEEAAKRKNVLDLSDLFAPREFELENKEDVVKALFTSVKRLDEVLVSFGAAPMFEDITNEDIISRADGIYNACGEILEIFYGRSV